MGASAEGLNSGGTHLDRGPPEAGVLGWLQTVERSWPAGRAGAAGTVAVGSPV